MSEGISQKLQKLLSRVTGRMNEGEAIHASWLDEADKQQFSSRDLKNIPQEEPLQSKVLDNIMQRDEGALTTNKPWGDGAGARVEAHGGSQTATRSSSAEASRLDQDKARQRMGNTYGKRGPGRSD